jgi:hypothetical protein
LAPARVRRVPVRVPGLPSRSVESRSPESRPSSSGRPRLGGQARAKTTASGSAQWVAQPRCRVTTLHGHPVTMASPEAKRDAGPRCVRAHAPPSRCPAGGAQPPEPCRRCPTGRVHRRSRPAEPTGGARTPYSDRRARTPVPTGTDRAPEPADLTERQARTAGATQPAHLAERQARTARATQPAPPRRTTSPDRSSNPTGPTPPNDKPGPLEQPNRPHPAERQARTARATQPAHPAERQARTARATQPAHPAERQARTARATQPAHPAERQARTAGAAQPAHPAERQARTAGATQPAHPAERQARTARAAQPGRRGGTAGSALVRSWSAERRFPGRAPDADRDAGRERGLSCVLLPRASALRASPPPRPPTTPEPVEGSIAGHLGWSRDFDKLSHRRAQPTPIDPHQDP